MRLAAAADDQHKRWARVTRRANTCIAGWRRKSRFDYRWAHLHWHREWYLARLNERPAMRELQGTGGLPIARSRALPGPVVLLASCVSFGSDGTPPCFDVGVNIRRSRELFRIPPEQVWLGAVVELLLVVQPTRVRRREIPFSGRYLSGADSPCGETLEAPTVIQPGTQLSRCERIAPPTVIQLRSQLSGGADPTRQRFRGGGNSWGAEVAVAGGD